MHALQPKHIKLNEKDCDEILKKFNLAKSQLPKILSSDVALPENCKIGDVIRVERVSPDGKPATYYKAVV